MKRPELILSPAAIADRPTARGRWLGPSGALDESSPLSISTALERLDRPVFLVDRDGASVATHEGAALMGDLADSGDEGAPLIAFCPPLTPEQLGDPAFRAAHGLRFAYIAGAMANGIGSCEIVEEMARAGMIGFFGAAGLPPAEVQDAIARLQRNLPDRPYGFNLIHSPAEPALEAAVAEMYIRRRVPRVSASAYLGLTLPLVKYRLSGIHRAADDTVVTPNHVFAKVSRVEVARKFLSPPPDEMLTELVRTGFLSELQARLAATIPVAEDLTAEADSGGHTDNRPLVALLPTMLALRDELQTRYGFARRLRIGAAGGIATPASAAAAFAMGAAYVLTGSINQACIEAGTSDVVKRMLAEAGQADVIMAPAADMFEMGVKVQVLKRGTMFAMRARKLYEFYASYPALEALPAAQRAMLERDILRCTLDEAWAGTRAFFAERDPSQIERAERDPKHKLALICRSYLGRSSDWANRGDAERRMDYQVWCGPAMGAFNEWARGTILEAPESRRVALVARNLLAGAAKLTRAGWLRAQGAALSPEAETFRPRPDAELPPTTAERNEAAA